MAYLGKTFTLDKHEKFDEFLAALGVPKDQIDALCSPKGSTITLSKDGDTFTQTVSYGAVSFKLGEEFDETIGKVQAKTVCVMDGDTLTQTQKFPDGRTMTFKKEFSDNKLVETATTSGWDGVAYKYYSA
ncbi:fatty acid-binding protein 2-like [Leguminivora glycinivorella]|uniref:fatty acid-binding protein 2-like n=1 Tax=Leguminivora glycinivorella TaxID=1035111 RepID=UPI00200D5E37|nr:fatty acid-binding protein 2-like [Leguminivora glycinivorella]